MKGNNEIIAKLNELLSHELTAINQYFIHYRMLENWGYKKLGQRKRQESLQEMQHADKVIERILFLEGAPDMQRSHLVRVGKSPIETHRFDLALEIDALDMLKGMVGLTMKYEDHGTRSLVEGILGDEEGAVEWLETELLLVDSLGEKHYLAQQV